MTCSPKYKQAQLLKLKNWKQERAKTLGLFYTVIRTKECLYLSNYFRSPVSSLCFLPEAIFHPSTDPQSITKDPSEATSMQKKRFTSEHGIYHRSRWWCRVLQPIWVSNIVQTDWRSQSFLPQSRARDACKDACLFDFCPLLVVSVHFSA